MELKAKLKYKVISNVNKEIISAIESVYVFSLEEETNVIIITNKDKVYGMGINASGKLGLGHSLRVTEPTLITQLCGKKIIKIVESRTSMTALIEGPNNCQIYTWGTGEEGQLGRAYYDLNVPIVVNTKDIMITDMDSTVFGSVFLLTQSGSIYWFGFRYFNQSQQLIPIRVTGAEEQEFIEISSGADHIFARTITGKVYGLGYNSESQLGLGHNEHCDQLTCIEMPENVFIQRISTHLSHSLALSGEGNVYSFGYNEFGQLGNGGTDNKNIPQIIPKETKFNDIFVHKNMSFGVCKEGMVYIWGQTSDGDILSPKRTELKSIQEAIDERCEHSFTYKPFKFCDFNEKNRILCKMSSAFDNNTYSDLKIKINDQIINVHKWFIAANCDHFDTMISKNLSEYEIKGHTYDGYYAFLRCIYTDSIDTEDIKALIDFLDITNEYSEEELKLKCVQTLKPLIDTSNVCSLYSASIDYRSNELKSLCVEYVAEHRVELMVSEDYHQMQSDYAKQLITDSVFYMNN